MLKAGWVPKVKVPQDSVLQFPFFITEDTHELEVHERVEVGDELPGSVALLALEHRVRESKAQQPTAEMQVCYDSPLVRLRPAKQLK